MLILHPTRASVNVTKPFLELCFVIQRGRQAIALGRHYGSAHSRAPERKSRVDE